MLSLGVCRRTSPRRVSPGQVRQGPCPLTILLFTQSGLWRIDCLRDAHPLSCFPSSDKDHPDISALLEALTNAQKITKHDSLGSIGAYTLYDLVQYPGVCRICP
jgi:hypothetical protein